jgi:hypothetical protein
MQLRVSVIRETYFVRKRKKLFISPVAVLNEVSSGFELLCRGPREILQQPIKEGREKARRKERKTERKREKRIKYS